MPFCPKCDDEYQAGFETCVDCQVPLVETRGLEISDEKRASEEENYAADFFPDGDEEVIFCPSCWNEFAVPGAYCQPCGGRVVEVLPRPDFEAKVAAAPITRRMVFDDLTVDESESLELIYQAASPLEAAFIDDSLSGMGVDVRLGHDGLDGLEEPRLIGIWVPSGEAEAAVMLLPEDDEFQDPPSARDAYAVAVQAATQYLEFRKYRAVSELLEEALALAPDRPEAFMSFGMSAGQQGHVEAAAGAFEEVITRAQTKRGLSAPFEHAVYLSAVYHFCDEKAQPAYDGPRSERGWQRISEYVERHPRQMDAMLLRLDAAHGRGHNGIVRETLAALTTVNSQIFRVAGRHTEIRDEL